MWPITVRLTAVQGDVTAMYRMSYHPGQQQQQATAMSMAGQNPQQQQQQQLPNMGVGGAGGGGGNMGHLQMDSSNVYSQWQH